MPKAADGAFVFVESSLHVGTSEQGRVIDQPNARDEATGYPMIPSGSLRGSLLAAARKRCPKEQIVWAFGTPPGSNVEQEGLLKFTPARPLLFPIRTLKGVFAWITCPATVVAWRAEIEAAGGDVSELPQPVASGEEQAVRIAPESPAQTPDGKVVLEDVSFPTTADVDVLLLGQWLGDRAISQEPAYDFWRRRLARGIVVVADDVFSFFVQQRTPVVRRVAIDRRTGTAQQGAMWSVEMLPPESLLYTVVSADGEAIAGPVPRNAVNWLKGLAIARFQIGAGRTYGNGIVTWTWLNAVKGNA